MVLRLSGRPRFLPSRALQRARDRELLVRSVLGAVLFWLLVQLCA